MIFNTAEIRCIFDVLKILERGKSKYSAMFKETKVSHITLQNVLKKLEKKKFTKREDLGHMNVDYEINEKGIKLLRKLGELKEILK